MKHIFTFKLTTLGFNVINTVHLGSNLPSTTRPVQVPTRNFRLEEEEYYDTSDDEDTDFFLSPFHFITDDDEDEDDIEMDPFTVVNSKKLCNRFSKLVLGSLRNFMATLHNELFHANIHHYHRPAFTNTANDPVIVSDDDDDDNNNIRTHQQPNNFRAHLLDTMLPPLFTDEYEFVSPIERRSNQERNNIQSHQQSNVSNMTNHFSTFTYGSNIPSSFDFMQRHHQAHSSRHINSHHNLLRAFHEDIYRTHIHNLPSFGDNFSLPSMQSTTQTRFVPPPLRQLQYPPQVHHTNTHHYNDVRRENSDARNSRRQQGNSR